MPSTIHEILASAFRERPANVLELLRTASERSFPDDVSVTCESASFSELSPAELRADAALAIQRGERPIAAKIVEVQLGIDEDKHYSWPCYLAGLRTRLRCPVTLVVVTLDDAVARWAATPIALDDNGSQLVPLVVWPHDVPIIDDAEKARATPDLAALSLLAHRTGPHASAIARALHWACHGLDHPAAGLYIDLASAYLDEPARRASEGEMDFEFGNSELETDLARRFEAMGVGRGRKEGRAEALLDVLEARGFPVDEVVRSKVTRCRDADQLRIWIARAVTAETLDTVFDA